jgi:hypothetical protein
MLFISDETKKKGFKGLSYLSIFTGAILVLFSIAAIILIFTLDRISFITFSEKLYDFMEYMAFGVVHSYDDMTYDVAKTSTRNIAIGSFITGVTFIVPGWWGLK